MTVATTKTSKKPVAKTKPSREAVEAGQVDFKALAATTREKLIGAKKLLADIAEIQEPAASGAAPEALTPILHWRVCNVWDWLTGSEHGMEHGYPTAMLAEAYGGDEAAEINARTGCMACPLASRDVALEAVVELPQWAHFKAVLRLRALWEELRAPHFRLRKLDGRMGPLTFEARMYGLNYVLAIQDEVNALASSLSLPGLDILNVVEHARILELIGAEQWPNGWAGDERRGDDPYFRDANAGSDWMFADIELHEGMAGQS